MNQQHKRRCLGIVFSLVLLCGCLLVTAAAQDMPDVSVHTYTDDAPVVDTGAVFREIYEKKTDIEIHGERAAWYFFYENIYRSTEKWHDFSTAVTLTQAEIPQLDAVFGGTPAYLLDLRDGDTYPGTAEFSVLAGDVIGEKTCLLYAYDTDAEGVPILEPIAKHLTPDKDGKLHLTVTAASDYLLVAAEDEPEGISAFYRTVSVKPDGFFSGAAIAWIVFFTVVGLVLIGLVIYLITVSVIKKRKKKNKVQKKKHK